MAEPPKNGVRKVFLTEVDFNLDVAIEIDYAKILQIAPPISYFTKVISFFS